jgi:hypothetical protein
MKSSEPTLLQAIEVSLDLHSEPHVTTSAPSAEVYEAQEIIWKISPKSPVQNFYFFRESVYFFNENAACFIRPRIHAHERAFGIYNTHTIPGECSYILMVEHEGKYYTTYGTKSQDPQAKGDPMIKNR